MGMYIYVRVLVYCTYNIHVNICTGKSSNKEHTYVHTKKKLHPTNPIHMYIHVCEHKCRGLDVEVGMVSTHTHICDYTQYMYTTCTLGHHVLPCIPG